ncbi:helix-turn-helix domain-containing protein [Patulibacter sp. NPDC049589]|uniref:PucR family transcriptional regulator n=1 Tax=Patulibacter sp. NPDC049589 TaxID=3154731 RepID=UPI003436D6D3
MTAPIRSDLLAALTSDDAGHGHRMALALHERIPELAADPGLFADTEASCTANVTEILRVLTGGLPVEAVEVPPVARDYVVTFVHRRIPLAVLLRGYRVGQNHLWQEFAARLRGVAGDDPGATESLATIENLLFEYVDRLSDQLAVAYQDELERWVRSAAAVRYDTVNEILSGGAVDLEVASRRLGYELRVRHLAVLVTRDDRTGASASLEAAALAFAAAVGTRDTLLVPVGSTTLWSWAALGDASDDDVLSRAEAHVPPAGVRIAVGHPGGGVDGIRDGHAEAQIAAELALVTKRPPDRPTSYRAIELLSLLTADPERGRRFVRRQLGALGDPGAGTARLRETTLAFLEHGGSHIAAAHAHHLHKNTVYTRVRRAERLLGRPILVGDAALQDALRLAVAMPAEILGTAPDEG